VRVLPVFCAHVSGGIYPTASNLSVVATDACARSSDETCACTAAARRASVITHERAAWTLAGHAESSVTIDAGGYSTPPGDDAVVGTVLSPAFSGSASAELLKAQYDVFGLNYRDLRG
jgi:hypothetical protein